MCVCTWTCIKKTMNYMYVYKHGAMVMQLLNVVHLVSGCVVVYSNVLIWLPSVQAKHVYMYKCTYGGSIYVVGGQGVISGFCRPGNN